MTTELSVNNNQTHFPLYREEELLNIIKNLSKNHDKLKVIDEKIKQASNSIKEGKYEVQYQSLARRVGCGLAGTASLLICPISWIAGIFSLMADADDIGFFLFSAPVKLCSNLFAKATRSKELWERDLKEAESKKIKLMDKRSKVFSDMCLLHEQMKPLMIKIIDTCYDKLPTMLHAAITVGQKVALIRHREDS